MVVQLGRASMRPTCRASRPPTVDSSFGRKIVRRNEPRNFFARDLRSYRRGRTSPPGLAPTLNGKASMSHDAAWWQPVASEVAAVAEPEPA
jgi:hypothetical protein